jgi:hypothetical protein
MGCNRGCRKGRYRESPTHDQAITRYLAGYQERIAILHIGRKGADFRCDRFVEDF